MTDTIVYAKEDLAKMKKADLLVIAAAKGITPESDANIRTIVELIVAVQNDAMLNGAGASETEGDATDTAAATTEGNDALTAETVEDTATQSATPLDASPTVDKAGNVTMTAEEFYKMKSDIATDVINALVANFEENNKEMLEKARNFHERLGTLEEANAALERKIRARDTLHGSIDDLGKIG